MRKARRDRRHRGRREARRRSLGRAGGPVPVVDPRRAVRLAWGVLFLLSGVAAAVLGVAGVALRARRHRRGGAGTLLLAAPFLLWRGVANLRTGFGPGERPGDPPPGEL